MLAVLTASATATVGKKNPVPPQLAKYVFQPGHAPLEGAGRPKGSLSFTTRIEKAAPQLAEKYVEKALSDAFKDQGAMLRHVADKFMPNAGSDGERLAIAPFVVINYAPTGLVTPLNQSVISVVADVSASETPTILPIVSVESCQP